MFYVLSKTLDVLLSPLGWAIALAALAALFRRRERTRFAAVACGSVLYLFSIEPVSNALQRALEESAPSTLRAGVTYDAAILLGGVVEHQATRAAGVPSYNENIERLLATYDLLRHGRARDVIITGGRASSDDPIVEARVLADQLRSWGIASSRIVLEERARNTRENALFSRQLATERRYSTLVVVTSAFHMRRAMDCFRQVGLEVDAYPVDRRAGGSGAMSWLPRAEALSQSSHALRELFGGWMYRVVGYGSR